jgi:hypothetical protein
MDAQNGYFSDTAGPDEPEAQDNPQEEKSETKTALLPLDFFQGKDLKPGDTCTIRVEQVMEDQASVSYMGDESGNSQSEYPEAAAPAQDDMMA